MTSILKKGGKMKVAISGSSGFLGSHLHKALADKKYSISTISQELLYNPKELEAFFNTEQPEYIYHLAAYGNMANQKDVAMTVFANVISTYNMLDKSQNIPYKKFINFSTSSVLLPVETFYSASKAGAERLANAFMQRLNKKILTVRPFSIYGDGEAEFRFIPTVISSLLRSEQMNLDPTAYHDWVYVGDFIDTLLNLAKSNITGVVNMGTGKQFSNMEIVNLLQGMAGKKLKYKVTTMREFDTAVWVCPQPTVKSDIYEGLKKTYNYYLKLYGN